MADLAPSRLGFVSAEHRGPGGLVSHPARRRCSCRPIDAVVVLGVLDQHEATPPSRSRSASTTAPRAVPRFRPARPPAPSRPSSLRDGDTSRYLRQGRRARPSLAVIEQIGPGAGRLSRPASSASIDQTMIDLDATPHKGQLGANAILGVSLAVAHAAAEAAELPLVPLPGRPERAPAAGADDEHPQRRRARRHQRRHPGVHDRADRRGDLLARRCAGAPRSTTRSSRC